MTDHKPTIVVDFDGVIHHYVSPWTKETEINDPPTPGAMEFLRDMTEHFRVCVLSTRSKNPLAVEAMRKWMIDHWAGNYDKFYAWFSKIEFPTEKPPAVMYIDDRAHLFTRRWPTAEEIKAFVPWNKKPSYNKSTHTLEKPGWMEKGYTGSKIHPETAAGKSSYEDGDTSGQPIKPDLGRKGQG